MTARRTALAACAALAAGLAAPAAAGAQDLTTPVGNFGGGTVVSPPRNPIGAGNMVIGLRARPGRRLEIETTLRGACGGGTFPARATVRSDGTFRARGTVRREPETGRRLSTAYRISGVIGERTASGSASATIRIRTRDGRLDSCRTGSIAWQARRATGEVGTPGATARQRLYGVTTQRRSGVKRGIVLRVSADGSRLTRALYGMTLRCGRRSLPDIIDTPKAGVPISAGVVSDRERFEFRDRTTITSGDERFEGTIGARGAAGTFSVVSRTRDRRTGRTLETCRSGTIRWSAAP